MNKKLTKKDLPQDVSKLLKDIYGSVGVTLPIKPKSKVIDFEDLLNPIKDAYEQIIIKKSKKFVWKGPKTFVTDTLKANTPSIDQLFDYKTMKSYQEQSGRDFMEQILISAIQIGIDQGVQIEREEAYKHISDISESVRFLESSINNAEKKTQDKELIDRFDILKSYVKSIKSRLQLYFNH